MKKMISTPTTSITTITNNALVAKHIEVCSKAHNSVFKGTALALLNKIIKGNGSSPENWGCCYYYDIEKGA